MCGSGRVSYCCAMVKRYLVVLSNCMFCFIDMVVALCSKVIAARSLMWYSKSKVVYGIGKVLRSYVKVK